MSTVVEMEGDAVKSMTMPEFDLQSRYDYGTNYHLTLEAGRFGKALAHIEAYRMTQGHPRRNRGNRACAKARCCAGSRSCIEVLGNYSLAKIIGFDIFGDDYPDTEYAEDQGQRNHWIDTEAGVSISVGQLSEVFSKDGHRELRARCRRHQRNGFRNTSRSTKA